VTLHEQLCCHLRLYGKYSLAWAEFHKTDKSFTALHADRLYRISSKSVSEWGKDGHKFTWWSEAWLSLRRFSWNSQLLKGIMQKSSVLNFTQIGQGMWKLWVDIYSRSSVNMTFSEPVFTKLVLAGQFVQEMYKPNFPAIYQTV